MSEFLEEVKKIGEKVQESNEAIVAAQKAHTELEAKFDASEKRSADNDSTVKAAAESAAKAMEEVQKLVLKMEASDKAAEYIEKMISRMPGAKGEEASEMEEKARKEMALYLKRGIPLSDDVRDSVTRALLTKSFTGVEDSHVESEIKTLIAGQNAEGGFFLRPERSAKIIKRIFETSPMRSVADVQTVSGDALEFIIDDNEAASGGWVGETDSRQESGTPKVGLLTIPVHEQYASPRATQKMIDDAGFDVESWLQGKVERKMIRLENSGFVVGDGSQKPRGFTTYDPWTTAGTYERHKLEQVKSGSNGAFTGDGIKRLQNSLIEEYQANAVFATKRQSWAEIITLKDSNNAYLLDPRSFKNGDTPVLLGKDVIFFNDMQDVANDSLSLAYGDFGVGYTIVDRIGFRVVRDIYTNKPYIIYYVTKRTGGAVTNFEAIKIQKLAA